MVRNRTWPTTCGDVHAPAVLAVRRREYGNAARVASSARRVTVPPVPAIAIASSCVCLCRCRRPPTDTLRTHAPEAGRAVHSAVARGVEADRAVDVNALAQRSVDLDVVHMQDPAARRVRSLHAASAPVVAMFVVSGSPPPLTTAWVSESLPPMLLIVASGSPATIGLEGHCSVSTPCSTRLPPG